MEKREIFIPVPAVIQCCHRKRRGKKRGEGEESAVFSLNYSRKKGKGKKTGSAISGLSAARQHASVRRREKKGKKKRGGKKGRKRASSTKITYRG